MLKGLLIRAALLCGLVNFISAAEAGSGRAIVEAKPEGRLVGPNTMQRIYDEVKTPFKYGVVIRGSDTNELVDCPSIFRSGEHWYMMYVAISNKVGYQTFLARSDDLLHWEKLGRILSFGKTNAWDAWQADGGVALADYRWDGSQELEKFDGKFWLTYIGGAKQGTKPIRFPSAWRGRASRPGRANGPACRKTPCSQQSNLTCAILKPRRFTKARSSTTKPDRSAGRL